MAPPPALGYDYIFLIAFGCIVATLRKRLRPSTSRLRNYVQATGDLQVRSCLIDGEAVACDRDGLPSFDRVRYRRQDGAVFLYAFDLLELDGWDLRREPIEVRKRKLATLLRSARFGLQLNEHIAESGDVVFRHACKLVAAGRTRDRGQPASTSGVDRQRPAGQALRLAPPSAAEIREPVSNRTLSAIFWVIPSLRRRRRGVEHFGLPSLVRLGR